MVSTTAARSLLTTVINDNTAGDVTPADLRSVFSSTFDAIDKIDKSVNVLDYGAKLDGTTDDTAAWNAALATGKRVYFPEGVSVITNKLNFPAIEGCAIYGASRNKCWFKISYTNFNMAASAVIQFNYAYQGVSNVTFMFNQPTTTLRSSLKAYPPAIDINGMGRAEISCIRIEAGITGIKAVGNCGGAIIDDVQMCCFTLGIVFDGALDSVRINRLHYWPFGFTGDANLVAIYGDGTNVSLDLGRCDDLNISSVLTFQARIRFRNMGNGDCFGVGSNFTLDSTYGRIEFDAGEMALSGVYASTAGAPLDYGIKQTGGELKISGLAMEHGDLTTNGMLTVEGGNFLASDILITNSSNSARSVRQTGGEMLLSNGKFFSPVGGTRTTPMIDIAGGRAILTGLRASDKGAGTGNFISVTGDDHHVVAHNAFTGWGLSIPATQAFGIYANNSGLASAYVNNALVQQPRIRRLTGTLDASGNLTIAHGLSGAVTAVIGAEAFYTSAASVLVAIQTVSVDATNVILAAGSSGASRAATIVLTYV